jgi:hypothetical protein
MNPLAVQDIYPQHVNWDEEHRLTGSNTRLFRDNHSQLLGQTEKQARSLTTTCVGFLLGLNDLKMEAICSPEASETLQP